ncbi:hypothetical protein UF75_2418 [Desulfosporosinus sp. I2]|nr:hypothetical protein UF75_2418 [Desulfosporosinus sp. I2]
MILRRKSEVLIRSVSENPSRGPLTIDSVIGSVTPRLAHPLAPITIASVKSPKKMTESPERMASTASPILDIFFISRPGSRLWIVISTTFDNFTCASSGCPGKSTIRGLRINWSSRFLSTSPSTATTIQGIRSFPWRENSRNTTSLLLDKISFTFFPDKGFFKSSSNEYEGDFRIFRSPFGRMVSSLIIFIQLGIVVSSDLAYFVRQRVDYSPVLGSLLYSAKQNPLPPHFSIRIR